MGFDNCIKKMLKIHHCSFIQNSFIALKKILCPLLIYSFPLPTLATTDLFTVSIVLPFPECHTVGIISYVAFSDWLLPLSNCIQVLAMSFHGLISYFFLVLNISHCQDAQQFIDSPTKGHLCCFQVLVILNKVAINISVQHFCGNRLPTPLSKCQGA